MAPFFQEGRPQAGGILCTNDDDEVVYGPDISGLSQQKIGASMKGLVEEQGAVRAPDPIR